MRNVFTTSLYILEQQPPPLGNPRGWPKPQVWGTIGSGLTPRVRKCPMRARFPALISVGGRRQVPGGPELGHPQELFFWESC